MLLFISLIEMEESEFEENLFALVPNSWPCFLVADFSSRYSTRCDLT